MGRGVPSGGLYMVLLQALCLPACPRRVSHWGSASLSWVVTELSTIPEGGSPPLSHAQGLTQFILGLGKVSIGSACGV